MGVAVFQWLFIYKNREPDRCGSPLEQSSSIMITHEIRHFKEQKQDHLIGVWTKAELSVH